MRRKLSAPDDELRTTEARLARLSVLQELTAAALLLADVGTSVDEFLQHVAERLGFVAVLWLVRDPHDGIRLEASAGISRRAREQPIEPSSRPLDEVELSYPVVSEGDLARLAVAWRGNDASVEHCLRFYFAHHADAESGLAALAGRITEVFRVAVSHRAIYVDLQRSYQQLEQAQRALVERERLAALGEMAAAVAHEVRNPLGAIFNSIATLRRVVRRDPNRADELLSIAHEEAARLNDIVTDLLEFAKPGAIAWQEIGVGEVLDGVLEAARAAGDIPLGVRAEIMVEPALPRVTVDARLLRQALLNLLSNALQVTPAGGRVLLSATLRRGDGTPELLLAVADQGGGIEPSARDRIFEPFYTTKSTGTGLGLAIVKRVVEAHGGRLAVESSPGVGTTFTIVLPVLAR